MKTDVSLRAAHFNEHHLMWSALSHFLSADLIHELSVALVTAAGIGRVSFDDLARAELSEGSPALASWNLVLSEGKRGFQHYLQNAIRALAWQNDGSLSFDPQALPADEVQVLRNLELAFGLGLADLGSFEDAMRGRQDIPAGLEPLVGALRSLLVGKAPLAVDLEDPIKQIPAPLNILVAKHLGDLCADVDEPEAAMRLYTQAGGLCEVASQKEWRPLLDAVEVFILQSRAAMLRLLDGPRAASELLLPAINATDSRSQFLLRTNAAVDAINAQIRGSDGLIWPEDIRTATLVAPQLLISKDLGRELGASNLHKYRDAHRRFWATLRRQVALGSASDARETKAFYGRSLLDELKDLLGSQRRPDTFMMALRLLVESGNTEIVERHAWDRALLEAYLTPEAIADVRARASRAPGAVDERQMVLVALAKGWLKSLPPEALDQARELLTTLADLAEQGPWARGGLNVPQASLKALEDIARERPDLSALASGAVANAVLSRLQEPGFRANWAALDTALAFENAFEAEDLRRCIDASLEALDETEPSSGAWPVVSPALSIISGDRAQELWTQDDGLARRSAAAVLRFGLGSASENSRLLFLLKDLGRYIEPTAEEAQLLDEMVLDVRRGAQEINSSAVTGQITALLAAPAVTRLDGVRDAISGLLAVIKSAGQRHKSLGLGSAYRAVMLLSQEKDQIAAELSLSPEQMHRLLEPLLTALKELWRVGAEDPLVFSAFAIPEPTTPNPVLVHNWAFATIGFGRAMNSGDELSAAIDVAARNPALANDISIARAARLTAGDPESVDLAKIAEEARAPFYAALGNRLALLARAPADDRVDILETLLQQCLRHGPDGLDAGVFALAVQAGKRAAGRRSAEYAGRLRTHRTLNLSLGPLYRALLEGGH